MNGTNEISDELFAVFREVAPEVLGRKKTRRLMDAMLGTLLNKIPINGAGPVIERRREAFKLLIARIKVMEEDQEAA